MSAIPEQDIPVLIPEGDIPVLIPEGDIPVMVVEKPARRGRLESRRTRNHRQVVSGSGRSNTQIDVSHPAPILVIALMLIGCVVVATVIIGLDGLKTGTDEGEPKTRVKNTSALKVDPTHTPPEDRRPDSYRD